jgi:membrane-bound lytic murein transglycosylase D
VAVAVAEPERPARAPRKARAQASAPPPAPVEVAGLARGTIKVASGDSLWAIARRLGVALEQLCRWNGIRNPRRHRLLPGDELVVYSAPGQPSAGPPG